MSKPRLKVVPLGGTGEIGKNMFLLEFQEAILVIDAGIMFPEEEMLGIDLVIPDISYLREHKEHVLGIIITHGHEDHAGALPYILPELPVPVYGTRLTQGLIEAKLKEHHLVEGLDFRLVQQKDRLQLGPFDVEFFPVNHSVPDGVGLAVRTPVGTIVHTGDCKIDHSPVDGPPMDLNRLAEIGAEGVLLFMSDCTRVEQPGYTPSERVVGERLRQIIAECYGRLLMATFASNISRIQLLLDAAYDYDRKVAVAGRSIETNVAVARELGYLKVPPDTLIRLDEANRLPKDRVVLLTTGTQGEPMSVLSRIANGDHRQIKVDEGDTVVISASPIPGNEELVHRTINNLFKQGADVIYGEQARVHVSGHASREELKLLLRLLKPRFCMPIHGEYRHMVHYARMAREIGYADEAILLPENGQIIELGADSVRFGEKVPVSYVYVDGLSVGGIGEVVLRDRQLLAKDGMLIVVVSVDRRSAALVAGPDIISRGFIHMRDSADLIEATKERVREALDHEQALTAEWSFVHQKIKTIVSRFLYESTKRRPMVLPIVMEV